MAQPIPCSRCEEGTDSSWLLTARDELTGMEPGTTLGICAGCWPVWILELASAIAGTVPVNGGAGDDDEPDAAVHQLDTGPKSGGTGPPKSAKDERTKAATSAPSAHD